MTYILYIQFFDSKYKTFKQKTNDAILDQIILGQKGLTYIWFGLNDYEVEGTWKNGDDSALGAFTNWRYPSYPNGKTNEQCATLNYNYQLVWDDLACKSLYGALFEVKSTDLDRVQILFFYRILFLRIFRNQS